MLYWCIKLNRDDDIIAPGLSIDHSQFMDVKNIGKFAIIASGCKFRVGITVMEFIPMHKFYLSDGTGEIIGKDFLKLPYPSRWKHDILGALDYFQYSEAKWDEIMIPAINVLL